MSRAVTSVRTHARIAYIEALMMRLRVLARRARPVCNAVHGGVR